MTPGTSPIPPLKSILRSPPNIVKEDPAALMETASAPEASYKSNPTITENKPGNPSDTFIPGSYDYSPVGTSNILTSAGQFWGFPKGGSESRLPVVLGT